MRDIAGIVREALGKEVAKGGVRSVSGGDINDAYLVAIEDGQKVFLKVNSARNAAFFTAEQAGLEALRKTDAIGVPKAITAGVPGLFISDHGISGSRTAQARLLGALRKAACRYAQSGDR